MSTQNVLILEPDDDFAVRISNVLKNLGFQTILRNDVRSIKELIALPVPIKIVIINNQLESLGGYSVYSLLKKTNKFKNSFFIFLSDNGHFISMLKNKVNENVIVLNKSMDVQDLLYHIINGIYNSDRYYENKDSYTEIFGNFLELPLESIMLYCTKTCFTGTLLLFQKGESGSVTFEFGERKEVLYKNFDHNAAIEIFHTWKNAYFRLDRHRYQIFELRNIINKLNSYGRTRSEFDINYNDLFVDIYNFLYFYLLRQIPEFQVSKSFTESIRNLKFKHPVIENIYLNSDTSNQEKIILDFQIKDKNIPQLIELFHYIFMNAQFFEPELELNDVLIDLAELEPMLRQINFYQILFSQSVQKYSENKSLTIDNN